MMLYEKENERKPQQQHSFSIQRTEKKLCNRFSLNRDSCFAEKKNRSFILIEGAGSILCAKIDCQQTDLSDIRNISKKKIQSSESVILNLNFLGILSFQCLRKWKWNFSSCVCLIFILCYIFDWLWAGNATWISVSKRNLRVCCQKPVKLSKTAMEPPEIVRKIKSILIFRLHARFPKTRVRRGHSTVQKVRITH